MTRNGFSIGDRVRDLSDPHTKWRGTVTGFKSFSGFIVVKWDSGLTEYVISDQIRKVEDEVS